MIRLRSIWSLPTTGTLFSAWQATTHAEQPVHALRSIAMPQACSPWSRSAQSVGSASASLAASAAVVQLLQRCLQHNGPAFHGKVRLRAGHLLCASGLFYLNIICTIETMPALSSYQRIGVHSNVLPGSPNLPPPVAQSH